jgi:hypothetical protein
MSLQNAPNLLNDSISPFLKKSNSPVSKYSQFAKTAANPQNHKYIRINNVDFYLFPEKIIFIEGFRCDTGNE